MDRSLLARAAIFEGLNEGELDRIVAIAETREYRYGEYVFREGDEGDRLFIVERGAIRISRSVPGSGEEAITILRPGACFGEMAVFDRSARSTDAIVESRATLLSIARPDFERLLEADRDLGYKVLRAMVRMLSHRLRVTNDQLQSILVMAMF